MFSLLFVIFSIYSDYVHPKYLITSSPNHSLWRVIFGSCEIILFFTNIGNSSRKRAVFIFNFSLDFSLFITIILHNMKTLNSIITSALQSLYNSDYIPEISVAPKAELGEYCINVFPLAKTA